jgi:hypothetical protein
VHPLRQRGEPDARPHRAAGQVHRGDPEQVGAEHRQPEQVRGQGDRGVVEHRGERGDVGLGEAGHEVEPAAPGVGDQGDGAHLAGPGGRTGRVRAGGRVVRARRDGRPPAAQPVVDLAAGQVDLRGDAQQVGVAGRVEVAAEHVAEGVDELGGALGPAAGQRGHHDAPPDLARTGVAVVPLQQRGRGLALGDGVVTLLHLHVQVRQAQPAHHLQPGPAPRRDQAPPRRGDRAVEVAHGLRGERGDASCTARATGSRASASPSARRSRPRVSDPAAPAGAGAAPAATAWPAGPG